MAIDPVIAQILQDQGKLMARLDAVEKAIMCDSEEDKAEGETESEDSGPELSTNPAIHSTQLEFDIPPIF